MHKYSKGMGVALLVLGLTAGLAMAETARQETKDHRGSEAQESETVPATRGERQSETVPAQRGAPNSETVPAERGTLSAPSDLVLWRVGRTNLTLIWMDNASFEFGIEVERGTPTRERGGVNHHWERIFNIEERVESHVDGTGMRTDVDEGLTPDTQYCYRIRAYRNDTFSDYSQPECVRTQP